MQKLLALIIALAVLPTVLATHDTERCQEDEGNIAIGVVEVGITPDQTYYVEADGGDVGAWQETNGIPGLQKGGGASPFIPDDAETCFDETVEPDTRIL